MREIHKNISVEGRSFRITKFDAATAIKVSKLVASKLLPTFNSIKDALFTGEGNVVDISEMTDFIDLEEISKALDLVSDKDLDRIIDASLNVCEEELAGGPTKVKNSNGSYAVMDLEYDPVLVMRLVCEAVLWGTSGFFDGSRLISVLKPLSNSFKQGQ